MPINFNGQIHDRLPEPLEQAQRALFYGDSLFESVRMFDGKMPLLAQHWARLHTGLALLGFEMPAVWNLVFFQKEIQKVATGNARVRLQVWRSSGGLFLPEDNAPQFLITVSDLEKNGFDWPEQGIELGLCETVRLPIDTFSNCKTLNAARYVAAAREAAAKGWNEALLLNARELVCEATSSNVFWWSENTLCTVPLSEGCVAGVMRAFLLDTATAAGYAVHEKAVTFTHLQTADEIFLSNAIRGMIPVRIFEGKSYPSVQSADFFEAMQKRLF